MVAQIQHDIEHHASESLMLVETLDDAADYVGRVCVEKAEQARERVHHSGGDFVPEASFILGGEIRGGNADIAHIYPEGNFVHASASMPFLQIGEVKYGKPILDRIIHADTSIRDALKAALVSMDSTMRSNATVGPPVECFVYRAGSLSEGRHFVLDEHHDYLLTVRRLWAEKPAPSLRLAAGRSGGGGERASGSAAAVGPPTEGLGGRGATIPPYPPTPVKHGSEPCGLRY